MLHIGAGTKCPITGARQHDDAHAAVGFDGGPDPLQLLLGLAVHGVHRRRPVERNVGDAFADLEQDLVHCPTSAAATARTSASTSSVCSPSRGGARRMLTRAFDIRIGLPMRRIACSPSWPSRTISLWAV